ncbi:MAG TPA: ATP-binding cassette domain-containing protein [Nevskiaceae bacterium]|nr:ATP-binding cassette domain-containing protein [Nevskiaceae bacterium]
MLLQLKNLSLSIGSTPLLDHVDLTVERGERVCLVGRNGMGKSTLLKVIAGEVDVDDGEVIRARGSKIATLPQDVPRALAGTVRDVVAQAGDVQPYQVDAMISRLELDPDADFAALSGGLKRRVLLGRALVAEPDLLMLDEPTNHLDIDSIVWLENFLLDFHGALLFVTHDRALLRKLATRIIELDRGWLTSWPGDYDNYLRRKSEALHAESQQNALFDKRLAAEEVWIRKGIEARRTRDMGRVKRLLEMRSQYSERRKLQGQAKFTVTEAERSGKLVAAAKGVSFSYENKTVIRNLSTTILRGDKVGIIGPNGAGKTTLLKLLLGELQPTTGSVRIGVNLQVAYFDQLRAKLDDDKSVAENIGDGKDFVEVGGARKHVMSYLSDFLFTPDRARSPVRSLSGGERNRLLLARLFARPANLLVLDEPTNDLDVETLDLLEELLLEFSGTILLVSHDREFLNRVVTDSLVFEGDGRVSEYVGGYDDWLRQRPEQVVAKDVERAVRADKPEPPKRLSYKDRRELDALPARIEKLEADSHALTEQMGAPEFYRKPSAEIVAAQQRLGAVQAELAAAYHRWQELEALADLQ